jgi:hypothetical protein
MAKVFQTKLMTVTNYFILWQLLSHIHCMKYNYINLKVMLMPYLPIQPKLSKLKLPNTFSNHEGYEH